jgi:hypothetical protein
MIVPLKRRERRLARRRVRHGFSDGGSFRSFRTTGEVGERRETLRDERWEIRVCYAVGVEGLSPGWRLCGTLGTCIKKRAALKEQKNRS